MFLGLWLSIEYIKGSH